MIERLFMVNVFIAFLRSVNVGGKNIIKMADLKHVLEQTGLRNVQTYLQSGNVLFASHEKKEVLKEKIEHAVKAHFHVDTDVILRTSKELSRLLALYPYTDDEASAKPQKFYVLLLDSAPRPEDILRLKAYADENNLFEVSGKEVFFYFKYGILKSKLNTHLALLNVPSTMRGYNTMQKLAGLSRAIPLP
jgi:uncharacterized protein (DUF1697 family)